MNTFEDMKNKWQKLSIGAILVLCFLLLVQGITLAQEINFTASVNKNPVTIGDHFSLTLTIENGKGAITAPDFSSFNLLYGPGSSTSVQIVNGHRSSTFSYTYTLSPKKIGTFKIGPAKANVNGRSFTSNVINLKVIKGGATATVNQGSRNRSNSNPSQVTGTSSSNLIIKIILNKTKAYVGESVLATFVLYSRYQALELQEFEPPPFNGFWSEEIENKTASWDDKIKLINGKQYRKATLKQVILIPQHAGNIKIGKTKLTALVNASFFNRGDRVIANSTSAVLKVMPLPEGKPANFSGAVGTFELSASTPGNKINTNDALDYIVEVKGVGNLKLVNEFTIDFPGDFEKYDAKTSENIKVDRSGMHGYKKWDYLLIPRHAGEYTIPGIAFNYFDLKTRKYKTLHSKPISISVAKGKGNSNQPGMVFNNVNKQDFQILDEDIRYINNTPPKFIPNGDYLIGSTRYYIFFFSPAILFFLLVFIKRKIEASSKDIVGQKMKKARRKANNHLKKATSMIGEGGKDFYDEIFAALYGYIRDRLNMGISELNKQQIRDRLSGKKIKESTIDELIDVLETSEMARFAPIGDVSRKELVDEAKDVINQIEKQVG